MVHDVRKQSMAWMETNYKAILSVLLETGFRCERLNAVHAEMLLTCMLIFVLVEIESVEVSDQDEDTYF